MLFIDRLIERIIETKNPSIIGLDTQIEFVPTSLRETSAAQYGAGARAAAEAIYMFNKELIDNIKDIVPAVKPQIAFYELYGSYGAEAFIKTASYAGENGLLVIADAKRNDIGSTATAYADAFLSSKSNLTRNNAYINDTPRNASDSNNGASPNPAADYGEYFADAITVNPYLGYDGIEPFIANCKKYDKGIFILVKTSNPSSGDFQDLELAGGMKVYEHIAGKVDEWGRADGLMGTYGYSSVCAVVGATYPSQAKTLREKMKRTYFLVPGYGAQGGSADDAAAAFDDAGLGAIVNASRSVLRAWTHERWGGKYSHDDFAVAARAEALRMRDEINNAIFK